MSGKQTAAGADSARSGRMMAKHPNASVALGSGSGLGALIVWVVGLGGVMMPAEVGAVIGGGVAGVALVIGRRGIIGLMGVLWHGDQEPEPAEARG
jgi:hypothetical protein